MTAVSEIAEVIITPTVEAASDQEVVSVVEAAVADSDPAAVEAVASEDKLFSNLKRNNY